MVDGLMAELKRPSPNVTVLHCCKVCKVCRGIKGCNDGEGIEVFGDGDVSLGKFDLFVDASGVASPARGARFGAKAFYTGVTFMEGVVSNPEKVIQTSSLTFCLLLRTLTLTLMQPSSPL